MKIKPYITASFNTSDAKSDSKIEEWLNANAVNGYRLVSTVPSIDNGSTCTTLIMEKEPRMGAAEPEATKPEEKKE